LGKIPKGGEIAATYKSHVSVWIDLLPSEFIATPDLMVEVLHSMMKPDQCPVFIGRLGKDVAGDNDLVNVVKDGGVCSG
jgi:hypothetical protein